METYVVELTHDKALQLLRDLEALNVIRIHQNEERTAPGLSSKYRGTLTKEEGKALSKHISQTRSEWTGI
ncbi:hypothetical protein [Dyadobacter sp. Leaf189]|uniref:hypothetical protein n=1 Tax=Dyadobacter sp. Leaf189 TaxID=1736295 RepID=UPI0006FFC1EA|nr:hypothetical protein [Dyadobacter sp. Leaf189]KQS24764.1 hypothetical protein ASG33_23715 [Dyadobacter sp. Leaf189]